MVIQAGSRAVLLQPPSRSSLQASIADETLQEGYHDLANLDLTKTHSCLNGMTALCIADLTALALQAAVLASW